MISEDKETEKAKSYRNVYYKHRLTLAFHLQTIRELLQQKTYQNVFMCELCQHLFLSRHKKYYFDCKCHRFRPNNPYKSIKKKNKRRLLLSDSPLQ